MWPIGHSIVPFLWRTELWIVLQRCISDAPYECNSKHKNLQKLLCYQQNSVSEPEKIELYCSNFSKWRKFTPLLPLSLMWTFVTPYLLFSPSPSTTLHFPVQRDSTLHCSKNRESRRVERRIFHLRPIHWQIALPLFLASLRLIQLRYGFHVRRKSIYDAKNRL